MDKDPNMIVFLLGQLATAAGVYAAIRADLREALTRVGMVEKRVDRIEDHRTQRDSA